MNHVNKLIKHFGLLFIILFCLSSTNNAMQEPKEEENQLSKSFFSSIEIETYKLILACNADENAIIDISNNLKDQLRLFYTKINRADDALKYTTLTAIDFFCNTENDSCEESDAKRDHLFKTLSLAICQNNTAIGKFLLFLILKFFDEVLDLHESDYLDCDIITVLIWGIDIRCNAMVEFLAINGANVNATIQCRVVGFFVPSDILSILDYSIITCYYVTEETNLCIIKTLLRYGAEISKSNFENIYLHLGDDLKKIVLKDLSLKDTAQKKPSFQLLNEAIESNYPSVVQLITNRKPNLVQKLNKHNLRHYRQSSPASAKILDNYLIKFKFRKLAMDRGLPLELARHIEKFAHLEPVFPSGTAGNTRPKDDFFSAIEKEMYRLIISDIANLKNVNSLDISKDLREGLLSFHAEFNRPISLFRKKILKVINNHRNDMYAIVRCDKKKHDLYKALLFAVHWGTIAIAKFLLFLQADVNYVGYGYFSTLMNSVKSGNYEMVKLFITAGVKNIDLYIHGATALSFAIEKNSPEMVELLASNHADINKRVQTTNIKTKLRAVTPLQFAISQNKPNLEIIKILLRHGAKNDKDTFSIANCTSNSYEIHEILNDLTFETENK